jgi:hypothetical protein
MSILEASDPDPTKKVRIRIRNTANISADNRPSTMGTRDVKFDSTWFGGLGNIPPQSCIRAYKTQTTTAKRTFSRFSQAILDVQTLQKRRRVFVLGCKKSWSVHKIVQNVHTISCQGIFCTVICRLALCNDVYVLYNGSTKGSLSTD